MKAMVRIYQSGRLREVFEKKFGSEMRSFLIGHGVVSRDPSVSNFLRCKGLL